MHQDDRNFLGVVGLDEIESFALPIVHRVEQGRILEQPRIRIVRQRSAEIGSKSPFLCEKCAISLCGIIQSQRDVHDSARRPSLKISDGCDRRGDPCGWQEPLARVFGLVDADKDAAEPFWIVTPSRDFCLRVDGVRILLKRPGSQIACLLFPGAKLTRYVASGPRLRR